MDARRSDPSDELPTGFIAGVVRAFLTGKQSILLLAFALCLGAVSLMFTAREEDPQIVVPMADIFVQVPGASAEEVEKLVATPLERLLWQIDGVEYVYSMSRRDTAMATVRFYVGENREDSLIKLYNTLNKNSDLVPSIVTGWVVKPVEIDDVPIVMLTLHSPENRYDGNQLRRIGEELFHRLAALPDISRVGIVGGRPREIRVELDPNRMAGLHVSPMEIADALAGADASVTAGSMNERNRTIRMTADSFLRSAQEAAALVVGVFDSRPVYLRDVARVIDGPEEAASYSRIGFSRFHAREAGLPDAEPRPAVTLCLAKKKGTNAVDVAAAVLARVDELRRDILPDGVDVEVTRNYGQTAQTKVDDLMSSLVFAVLTVVALLAFTLGWREALVVALAVPVSFSLALFVNYLFGYTINRVTMFALILSLGLVVDDPITNVDNIQRHIMAGRRKPFEATLFAVQEVLPPVIMSTLAIIASFTPMFFITGMMGPYMAPMAANVPLTVSFSTVCALTIVPWLSYLLLKRRAPGAGGGTAAPVADTAELTPLWIRRGYRALIEPFLLSRPRRWLLAGVVVALLAASASLALLRYVPLKMLPFDNKNEFQLVIDMPEGTSLEASDATVRAFERFLADVPEVTSHVSFTGTASPMDFNGMVRHSYLRSQANQADIRVNLADKLRREQQSHAIVLRLRKDLEALAAAHGARLKIVETPPGPPVLSTITTEINGAPDKRYDQLIGAARQVQELMRKEPGVTDIDASFEARHDRVNFVPDKEKAALHGVDTDTITRTLALAVGGDSPATVHLPGERQPLPVRLVLPRARRSSVAALAQIPVKAADGAMLPLGELGRFETVPEEQPIYHKNLQRVVYVYAEMAGRAPGEAILDMQGALRADPLPPGVQAEWAGEGEWEITLSVFRDLGIAFAAALVGIYLLLIIQTDSFFMPLLIMMAIPLTLLGIMPGFWLLNAVFTKTVGGFPDPVFFTATSMIGMIALGGIVIRNSLVLIEFIQDAMKHGMELREAILQSGAIRLRPIVLTAATTALGAWPITLDPIFSGLAWALIFGLVASTLFTLVVIPVAYYAVRRSR
ncbi:MAG: efflux RND transporter permease subunit [Desulfovibrionaceae bacterium]